MRGQVTVTLPARGKGRPGRARGADVAPGAPGTAPAPTLDRIPRVARVLALAHHWQGLLRSGAVRSQADLSRLVGVSRARLTQVMHLLLVAPDIQEDVLLGDRRSQVHFERHLRWIAREPVWTAQRHALPGAP